MNLSNSHYLSTKTRRRYQAFGDEHYFETVEPTMDEDLDEDERFYPQDQTQMKFLSRRQNDQ